MDEKFKHKKSLGQHFLNSDYVPKKMCDAADVQAKDVVLEIGPGTGVLTRELLERDASVIALEADERAVSMLDETFAKEISSGKLVVHHMDARNIDFTVLGLSDQEFKVVANIPYYISGLLFRQCLESDIQPNTLVFLVQKEVAERIARNQKESILSLSVKVFGDPTYICTVKRGHFTPPPAVDSAIVAIRQINKSRFINITLQQYFDTLHLAFGQKRKQLAGNLKKYHSLENIMTALERIGLPLDIRAEDMSSTQFLQLVTLLYKQ